MPRRRHRHTRRVVWRPSSRTRRRLNASLGFVGLAWAIVVTLLPSRTPLATVIYLVVLFGVLLYPTLHIVEWGFRSSRRVIAVPSAFVCLLVGIVGFGSWIWPHPRRHVLAGAERTRFERPLQAQQAPREEIILACPQQEESTCVYAAQFINLFREAGWKVRGNIVERGMLGIPYSGVILVKRGAGQIDPNDWRSGLWSNISASFETVRAAIVSIGIEPDSISDAQLTENALRVYFGLEKDNNAERTPLTDMFTTIEQGRRSGKLPQRVR